MIIQKENTMKNLIIAPLPFLIMPIFIPIYKILDNLFFVDIFGCGCVPFTQTNMLNIPFNANDLRILVFAILTIVLSVWAFNISKIFKRKVMQIIYCAAVVSINILLTIWVVNTFMWA